MEYIKPVSIGFLETDVLNEEYSTWNSITEYTIGTKVILNDRYYEATATSTNQNPEEFNTTKTDLAVWSSPTVVNTKRCYIPNYSSNWKKIEKGSRVEALLLLYHFQKAIIHQVN